MDKAETIQRIEDIFAQLRKPRLRKAEQMRLFRELADINAIIKKDLAEQDEIEKLLLDLTPPRSTAKH